MIVNELLEPKSIAVIGGTNDITKPGGKVLKNIIDGNFDGKLMVVNPKDDFVQGIASAKSVAELDNVDLAIIAVACKFIPEMVDHLTQHKNCKAFIILSAGFSEVGPEGKKIEDYVVQSINKVGGSLIGPNCIGVMNTHYKGVFAGPIPKLDPKGVDFVTGSGATAVFILEAAIPMGLTFSSVYSVGNSAQMGVEEILQHWDETFDPATSSKNKMIYIEKVDKPDLLLKHARSLINKGCRIAAIKAGTTDAGSRAVSSHTGALAGSDMAVDALFKKAGIVRCHSKQELVYTAAVFACKEMAGQNIAVVTHAGGPGVMLTDALSKGGLKVPHISGNEAEELLAKLYHGSSVANPIDFLATGTAEQLGVILDTIDEKFANIDATVVIFGTTGLFDVKPVYEVLNEKMQSCHKPIFPVLPSIVQVKDSIEYFISLGKVCFTDEVVLGNTLSKIQHTPKPSAILAPWDIDIERIRKVISQAETGYLPQEDLCEILQATGIPTPKEKIACSKEEAIMATGDLHFPLAMKVIGPIHKTEVGGVKLGINSMDEASLAFDSLMRIEGAKAVFMQEMAPPGLELFIGAKHEKNFGHLILCGLGGIYIEVLKDIAYGLAPVNNEEALAMIQSLKTYSLIKGVRGKKGINEQKFAEVITRLSALLQAAPEIEEMDLNPLFAYEDGITAVDCRIKIRKA